MHDLALQVGQAYPVVIDDAEAADAGCREIHEDRRAEPARAYDQNAGRLERCLSRSADFLEQDMPGVARELFIAERHGRLLHARGTEAAAAARGFIEAIDLHETRP